MRNEKIKTELINLDKDHPLPEEYTCHCEYCAEYKGMLIRKSGSLYNRNIRRDYMIYKHGAGGAQHINPTPLFIARWAIQNLTKTRQYVLDPFIGTGTTAVEAINNNRHAWGTEIDTCELANENIRMNIDQGASCSAEVIHADARKIWAFVHKHPRPQLVILHPPYSGDEQANAKYDRSITGNMAFMKESKPYWESMGEIFRQCAKILLKGGYIVIGVKEMMRNKAWWDLHIKFNDLIMEMDNPVMIYKGMILLPHYPRTLHMNTYFKRYGVHPSYYQTITVWRKE